MSRKKTISQRELKFIASKKQQVEGLSERLFEIIALYNLSKSLNISFEMDSILVEAEKFMKHSLNINDFSILLLDAAGETLTVWKAKRANKEKMKNASFKMGKG